MRLASLLVCFSAIAAVCSLTACKGSTTTFGATGGGGAASSGGGGDGGEGGEGDGGEESWVVPTGAGGCDAVLYAPPVKKSPHVEECSVLEHHSNPPTSGPHYPRWAMAKTYEEPLPRGYYLHTMEHGAVVLAYKCAAACDDEIAAMQAWVDGLDPDPDCAKNRIVITEDPELDVPFAAVAWGHMLKASCFDEDLVQSFFDDHYADAPEDVCAGGLDPFDPEEKIPADCGK